MKKRWLTLGPNTPGAREVPLAPGVHQLGRGVQAWLKIEHKSVSSLHASLVCKADRVDLIDLDSTNGTFVNGRRVQNSDLKNGDLVRLADVELQYHEELIPDAAKAGAFPTRDDFSPDSERRRFEALSHLLEKALFAGSREELLAMLLKEIHHLLSLEVCGLFIAKDNEFYILENGTVVRASETDTVSGRVLTQVLETGKPVFLEKIGDDSGVVGFKSLLKFHIQSLLCLPVVGRDRHVAGVLYCVSRQASELHLLEKDRLFLSTCSSFIALALENLAFVDQARRSAHQSEKEKQESRFFPLVRKLREQRDNIELKSGRAAAGFFDDIYTQLPALKNFVEKSAQADLPVLLTGETGVGKTRVAGEIHARSRPGKPFVVVDCTAIPSGLVESELFGHEKGAFTGAVTRALGKVAAAGEGTLFVDEIGDLPLDLQGKLLRLVQTGEFEPLGATRTVKSRARLVFATHRDLEAAAKANEFRQDLFFRLNVLQFRLPPLRDVTPLILSFARYFLEQNRSRVNSKAEGFDAGAEKTLLGHSWPGNLRELENCVLRGLFNAAGGKIQPEDLEISPAAAGGHEAAGGIISPEEDLDLKKARERLDRAFIDKALQKSRRNVSAAARELNISRNALMELVKKYGL